MIPFDEEQKRAVHWMIQRWITKLEPIPVERWGRSAYLLGETSEGQSICCALGHLGANGEDETTLWPDDVDVASSIHFLFPDDNGGYIDELFKVNDLAPTDGDSKETVLQWLKDLIQKEPRFLCREEDTRLEGNHQGILQWSVFRRILEIMGRETAKEEACQK